MDRATFTTSGITSKNKQQKYVPVGNYPEGSLVVRERPVRHRGCLPGLEQKEMKNIRSDGTKMNYIMVK